MAINGHLMINGPKIGGSICQFLAKLVTYNRCVVVANGHIMTRKEPTMMCDGSTCPFLAKLVTCNRCVAAANGHINSIKARIVAIQS